VRLSRLSPRQQRNDVEGEALVSDAIGVTAKGKSANEVQESYQKYHEVVAQHQRSR
jgi:hypothetical protein